MDERGKESSGFAEQIRNFLLDGPASINDVCNNLKISWATAKSAIEDMKEKGDVREIISNPKIRIFKLTNDPAFYGVPLTKQQKNDALFLFESIKKAWKDNEEERKGPLLATTLQKIAVDVAKEYNCGIPAVPFHYGLVVPIADSNSYSFEKPEKSAQIISKVIEIIPSHSNKYRDEINKQYSKYCLSLFQEKENIRASLKQCDKTEEKNIKDYFSKLILLCPIDNNEIKMFEICSDFVGKIHGLIITNSFKNNLDEIREAFNILWDFITTSLFFKEIAPYIKPGKKEIFEYIKSSQLLSKKSNVEERMNYLESLIDLTKEIKLPTDDESVTIRKIMAEGAEEE